MCTLKYWNISYYYLHAMIVSHGYYILCYLFPYNTDSRYFAVIAASSGAIVILIVSIVAAVVIVIRLQIRVVSVDQKHKTAHVTDLSKGKKKFLVIYVNYVS